MKTVTKQVLILNNLSSPDIQQAIVILKREPEDETAAVMEAERVINKYLKSAKQHRKLPTAVLTLFVMLGTGILTLALYGAWNLVGLYF